MNITINPGAATEDAAQIDQIITQMEEDMQVLDKAIKNNIPDGIQTSWSDTLRGNWESFYTADIPQTMEEMKLSATNLRMAVDAALKYDQER